jgi:propionyl-CoA carboxylase alpha chain
VAISSLADMETLFDGIPLDQVSVSMTINGPAAIMFAFYVAAAEKQGVASAQIRGTVQNDILKEYQAQHAWVYPEEYPNGFNKSSPDTEVLNQLAMVALWIDRDRLRRLAGLAGRLAGAPPGPGSDFVVGVADHIVPLRLVGEESGAITVKAGARGRKVTISADWRPGEPVWAGVIGKSPLVVQCRPATGGVRLLYRGVDVVARVMGPAMAVLAELMPEKQDTDSGKLVRCPMPGLVVAINVAVGQEVKTGEAVAVVEAMKMENVLRAERDATIAKINAAPGDVLAVDDVIVEFE